MHSLQSKIFFFFVVLLISVQSIALWTINKSTDEQSQQSIENRLNTAATIFLTLFQSEHEKLSAMARTTAHDGGLREVFYDDQRSLLVALNNHRKRIDADIAFTIDDQKRIKAQLIKKLSGDNDYKITKGPEIGELFRYSEWLGNSEDDLLYPLEDKLYQISSATIKSGQENIGWIAFGFLIDKKRAVEFSELIGLSTNFIIQNKQQTVYLASSDSEHSNEAIVRPILANKIPNGKIGTFIELGHVGLIDQGKLKVVFYGSKSDILEAIEHRWLQFLMLATITLLLSLGGAYLISASISKPAKQLVNWAQFIANGNYDEPVRISDKGEMGQIAKEFSTMQSEILNREKTILYRAYHNSLTNLRNRFSLLNTLENEMSDTENRLTLFLINISHIKHINSSLGHDVGDLVIKEVGQRLSEAVNSDSLFHLGADEFVILIHDNSVNAVNTCYDSIHQALAAPYINKDMNLNLRFRSGVVTFPEQMVSPEELLQKADTALHCAKDRNAKYQVYDPEQDVNTLEQLSLMNDLSIAINEKQLVLFYQPKYSLGTRKIESVESLVRWQHPVLGMIPPDKFISIAESTGQINPLTFWVLEEAASQIASWNSKGIDLIVAVNISAENLKSPNFYETVCGIIKKYNVPVDSLMLEITESAVVDDPTEAIRLLQRFKEYGFSLSIDDYGTGYSSLAQLKDLPVNELKIDMSFVLNLPDDHGDKIIVKSTIDLAHSMGLTVVAEGVENEGALQWLLENKCEKAQGYHISRPVTAEALEVWLQETQFDKPNQGQKIG